MNLTPIVLYNNTSSASPAPFQQMLIIPANTSINSTYTNIRFRDGNYKLLTSWLESYTTSSATIWIVLPNGISSKSAMTIYMETGNLSDNFLDGVTVGEAPQLSGTYGQYDNGAKVFSFYDNFAGTSLSSSWSVGSGVAVSVDNGLTYNASNAGWNGLMNSKTLNAPVVEEIYSKMISGFAITAVGLASGNTSLATTGSIGYEGRTGSNQGTTIENPIGSSTLGTGAALSLNTMYIVTGITVNSTEGTVQINYGANGTATLSTASILLPDNIVIGGYNSMVFVQWIRVRAYPPGGVMPFILISQWQSGGE